MFQVIQSMRELNFGQLMGVYKQSNQIEGVQRYPYLSENEQRLSAQQDFYAYLKEFFKQPDSIYAIWLENGNYVGALRIERYNDGFLLAGLETMPSERRKGYAVQLITEVLKWISVKGNGRVYSHVDKSNAASLAVHRACGFQRVLEHAVYLDGSVLHSSCTFLFEII